MSSASQPVSLHRRDVEPLADEITGPLVWAPLGDVLGRKLPFLAGFLGFMCFTVGVATAQNLHTIMICRFMQGAWGVSTITVVPGMIVDLWRQEHRTMAVLSWAVTIVLGPSVCH